MKKEREVQDANRKQNQALKTSLDLNQRDVMRAQAEEVLKKQQALKSKDELVQRQQEPPQVESAGKKPPPRPRQRPQASPSKEPMSFSFDPMKFESSKGVTTDALLTTSSNSAMKPFVANFGAVSAELNASLDKNAFNKEKRPPARPGPPARPAAPSVQNENLEKQKEEEKKRKVSFHFIII